MLNKLNQFNSQ